MPRFAVVGFVFVLLATDASAEGAQGPLPTPTGSYAVGRTEFDWIDPSRTDPESPNGHREIVVWVWYPASPKRGAVAAPWMPGKWGKLLSETYPNLVGKNGDPNGLRAIRSHSYADAPLSPAAKTYPVLLFAPGMTVVPLAYATLIEDIVSHGYIVAGIVPTYYTRFTIFSDNRVVKILKIDQNIPPLSEERSRENDQPVPIDGRIEYTSISLLEAEALVRQYHDSSEAAFAVWTGDMIFTLNQLSKLNAERNRPFAGRFDLTRVGAFGHSFGGAASFEVEKKDARVRAAVDLDGSLWGDLSVTGPSKPLLMFEHWSAPEQDPPDADYVEIGAVVHGGDPGYLLSLNHSTHMFFSDQFLISSYFTHSAPLDGSQHSLIDPARALSAIDAYVEAFFDEYLKQEISPLLNGPSPEFPEVTFVRNK